MIHFGAEAAHLKTGITFYSWKEMHHSIGFKLVWWWRNTKHMYAIRYSVEAKRWFRWHMTANAAQLEKLETWKKQHNVTT